MADPPIPPFLFVVFGGTGDLMGRKLLPALYYLAEHAFEDARFKVLGVARNPDLDDDAFRAWACEALEEAGIDAAVGGAWCDHCLHYQSVGPEASAYEGLRDRIIALEQEGDLPGNRVFYLALPPVAFGPTVENLAEVGLNRSEGWTRLVVEKPFGHDLASAQELNRRIHAHFDEGTIYRIDHYLGKETVQNLLVFRFANPVFESLWNRDRVASVQITVAESLGVEGRARYYDRVGALRDMVQNHLTQLLTLTAMEVPATFEADAIRDEKVKVLRSIASIPPEQVVFGQYGAGAVAGTERPGYHEEDGVPPDSRTETFVAMRLDISNWRWRGVPFYLRTGKRMGRRLAQITVSFLRPPVALFQPFSDCRVNANALVLTLQPDEGFDLCFEVKKPGDGVSLLTQKLGFRYKDAFGPLPAGYELLLRDVLEGDQTHFVRADEVEASWRLYTPILEGDLPIRPYTAGSWGPSEADDLMQRNGDRWRIL